MKLTDITDVGNDSTHVLYDMSVEERRLLNKKGIEYLRFMKRIFGTERIREILEDQRPAGNVRISQRVRAVGLYDLVLETIDGQPWDYDA